MEIRPVDSRRPGMVPTLSYMRSSSRGARRNRDPKERAGSWCTPGQMHPASISAATYMLERRLPHHATGVGSQGWGSRVSLSV